MAAKQSRYLGVQPFKTSDRNIFFGRDDDIEDLHDFLLLEKLTVLFGKSGYGKSSLLSAGIVPKLSDPKQPEGFRFQPVEVRFGAYVEGQSASPLETVQRMLESIPLDAKEERAELGADVEENLWLRFKQRQTASGGRFVLIFDQFEELFSYPPAQQETFRRQLAELLYSDIPEPVRSRLDQLPEAARHAFGRPMNVKAVFAIRADRMSQLDSMKDVLPAILHKRYELRALPRAEAEKALTRPAALNGDFESPAFGFEAEATEKILGFLEDEQHRIDPIQLQILAESFEKRVLSEGILRFNAGNLGDLKAVIARYYSDKIAAIPDAAERLAARRLCEEGLVQESDPPVRLTLHEAQIRQFFSIPPALLALLVDSRLLRAEVGAGGGATYELPHDTLMEPVLEAKRLRLERERQAAAAFAGIETERKLREAEEKAAEEKRRAEEAERLKRRAQKMLLLAVAATLLAISGLLGAVYLYKQANTAKTEAQRNETRATEALQKVKEEQAAKAMLEIRSLKDRGERLFKNRFYQSAKEMFEEADTLTQNYPDMPEMQRERQELEGKIKFCDQNLK